jgi:asparagine synthase (glutamine-hydrolysing)
VLLGYELILTAEDVATRTPEALGRLDKTLADPAFIALHLLAEFSRRLVTVAVGGEGADELFGRLPTLSLAAAGQSARRRPGARAAGGRPRRPLGPGR